MTRKDTIFIAAIVNAALLIVLFVTAIKREEKTPLEISSNEIAQIEPLSLPQTKQENPKTIANEIDEVLNEFSQSEKKGTKTEKKTSTIDFAKELEAITKATTPVEKKASTQTKEVVVQKGDFLEKIARAHQVSVEELVACNHLHNTTLQIGQVLKIPEKGKSKTPYHAEEFYIVKQGDNPWTIAVKNHIKVEELLRLNNLNEEKARRLRVGDKLRIHE